MNRLLIEFEHLDDFLNITQTVEGAALYSTWNSNNATCWFRLETIVDNGELIRCDTRCLLGEPFSEASKKLPRYEDILSQARETFGDRLIAGKVSLLKVDA